MIDSRIATLTSIPPSTWVRAMPPQCEGCGREEELDCYAIRTYGDLDLHMRWYCELCADVTRQEALHEEYTPGRVTRIFAVPE